MHMEKAHTQAEQDYLKAIFDLGEGGRPVTTSLLARHLGVSPASVTGMLQRLASARPALIVYRKHHGTTLTREGLTHALRVVRHHRLIESFLHRSLGMGWDEVHAEAHRLEHALSPAVGERLSAALGDPSRDPHGDPIPDRDLRLPVCPEAALSTIGAGGSAIIRRVEDADPAFLRHVASLGLVPGAALQVVESSDFDRLLSIRIGDQREPLVVGPVISDQVFVESRA